MHHYDRDDDAAHDKQKDKGETCLGLDLLLRSDNINRTYRPNSYNMQ